MVDAGHPIAGAVVDIGLQHPPAHGDSYPTPIWRATAADAAVNDGYSDRCSRTSRTARSRRAGSIFFGMTYILPTQKDAASNLQRFSDALWDDEALLTGFQAACAAVDEALERGPLVGNTVKVQPFTDKVLAASQTE